MLNDSVRNDSARAPLSCSPECIAAPHECPHDLTGGRHLKAELLRDDLVSVPDLLVRGTEAHLNYLHLYSQQRLLFPLLFDDWMLGFLDHDLLLVPQPLQRRLLVLPHYHSGEVAGNPRLLDAATKL